jgi:tRNA(fMet)-specific endonuclease VapC
VEGTASRERNAQRLRNALSRLILWPYTEAAAEEFGRLFAELRKRGRPRQQIDIQVGAVARSLGNTTAVSADSDLAEVPGLGVENWATA